MALGQLVTGGLGNGTLVTTAQLLLLRGLSPGIADPAPAEVVRHRELLLPHHWDERLVAAWSPGIQGAGGLVLRDQHGVNDGTLTNGPTWVNDEGPALSFDGVNDYVNCGVIPSPSKISVSAYFQTTTAGTRIISKDDGASNRDYLIQVNASGWITWVIWDSAKTIDVLDGSVVVTDGEWHHVTCTWDGSESKIYVDGKLDVSSVFSGTGILSNSSEPVYLGAKIYIANEWFAGQLDNVRIYSAALSPQEIAELWNGGERNAAYESQRQAFFIPANVATEVARTHFSRNESLWDGCTAAYIAEDGGTTKIRNYGNTGPAHDATPHASFPVKLNGGALSFEGDGAAGSFIDVPDPAVNIGTGGDTAWTYSVWAWTTQTNTSEYIYISRRSSGRHILALYRATYGNYLNAQYGVDYVAAVISGPGNLNDGKWHHILYTQRDDSYRELWYDGVLMGVDTATRIPTGSNLDSQSYIGNGTSTAVNAWTGGIDDFREYNRHLGFTEVQDLWNGGERRAAYELERQAFFIPDDGVDRTPEDFTVTRRELTYPNLSEGRVAAYSAGEQGPGGLVLRDQEGSNHGTLTNMDPATDWVDQALDFKATANQYVDTPYVINGNDIFTISFWMNLDTVTKNFQAVFDGFISSANRNIQIWMHTDSYLYVWHLDNVLNSNRRTSTTLVANRWYHVTYSGNGAESTGKLYIDGEFDNTITIGSHAGGDVTVELGRRNDASSASYLDGQLDDVAIYSRALSPQEIATLAKRRGIAYETNSRKISAKAPPTHVIAPRRTLTYPQLSIGRVAAYSAGEQGAGGLVLRDQSGSLDGAFVSMLADSWQDQALNFDGTEYIEIPYSDKFNTPSITVEAWINTTMASYGNIVDRDPEGAAGRQFQFRVTPTGKLEFISFIGGGANTTTGAITVNTGKWVHAAATYQVGTGTQSLWVNGLPDTSETKSGAGLDPETSTSAKLWIGTHGNATKTQKFTGFIAAASIYSRALSPQEIATLAEYRGIAYEMSHSPRIIGPATPEVIAALSLVLSPYYYHMLLAGVA